MENDNSLSVAFAIHFEDDLTAVSRVKKRAKRSTCDTSSIKPALGRFTLKSCKTTAKKCTTKCAARAKFFFANRAYSATKSG